MQGNYLKIVGLKEILINLQMFCYIVTIIYETTKDNNVLD